MGNSVIELENLVGVTSTQEYLSFAHGIKISSRTVRRWIATGLINGFCLKQAHKSLWFTIYDAVDDAVQAGRIPPPRGNPNWRKQKAP